MALYVLSQPYILLNYPQSSALYWNPVPAGSVPQKYPFLSNSFIPFTQSPEITYFSSTRQHTKYFLSGLFWWCRSAPYRDTIESSRHVVCGIRKTIKPSGKLETYSPNSQHHNPPGSRGALRALILLITNLH